MALENVEQFEKLLKEDKDLQAKLQAASEAYEGEKTDEALFEALLAPIADEVGLPFTYDEALAFTSRDHALSDDELDAVAGGTSGCYVIGGGSEPDADFDTYDMNPNGGACAYVGITIGVWD